MYQTWLEKLKTYLVEVVLNKIGPTAATSLVSLVAAFILAHQGALEGYGVNYIADWSPNWLATHEISGHILLFELDTTSLKAISAAFTLVVAFFAAGGHHIGAVVTGKPQTGGQRASDQTT